MMSLAGEKPVAEQPMVADDTRPRVTWPDARHRLAAAESYWLATVRPEGRPHVMPILAVWAHDALHFATSPTSRKGRNLARNPRCVVTARGPGLDLVVEGTAERVSDETEISGVAEAYAAKYGWRVTIRDGAFEAEGAPTAGPSPYHVYRLTSTVAFGFGTDDSLNATRWRF